MVSNAFILLERIKTSVKCCFNSVKSQVILKSDMLFPPNPQDKLTVFLKKALLSTNFHANVMFATLVTRLRD